MCGKYSTDGIIVRILYDLLYECGWSGTGSTGDPVFNIQGGGWNQRPDYGYFLDKFPVTKMGKFRPMIILGTIICVINYILLWFGAV